MEQEALITTRDKPSKDRRFIQLFRLFKFSSYYYFIATTAYALLATVLLVKISLGSEIAPYCIVKPNVF